MYDESNNEIASIDGTSSSQYIEANTAHWTEENLNTNTQYRRYIKAGNISGKSEASSTVAKYTYAAYPRSIAIESVSTNAITMTWENTAASLYTVEVATSNAGQWVTLSTTTEIRYEHNAINEDTIYYYKIGVKNADNEKTPNGYSEIKSTITKPFDINEINATATSESSIVWSWSSGTYLNENIIGYAIYSSTDISGNPMATLSPSESSWTENSLVPNTQYTRTIKRINTSWQSAGKTKSAYTNAATIESATSIFSVSTGSISVSWQTNANPQGTNYNCQIATSINFETIIKTSTTKELNATFNSLNINKEYYIRIMAENEEGKGTNYTIIGTTATLAKVPTSVAQVMVSSMAITISWNANANPAGTRYQIAYSTTENDNSGYITNEETTNTSQKTQTVLLSKTDYYLKVKAYNILGVATEYSQEIKIKTNPAPAATPANFKGEAISGSEIIWSWDAVEDVASYALYTLPGNGNIAILNATYYKQINLQPDFPAAYTCYVIARNIAGNSVASNSASLYTYSDVPSTMSVVTVSDDFVELSWEISKQSLKYIVERASETTGRWVAISSPSAANYTDTLLKADTTYYYRVGVINRGGIQTPDGYSEILEVVTLPAGPSGVNAKVNNTESITWSWSTGSVVGVSVVGFRVYNANTGGTMLAQLSIEQSSWTEIGLSANTMYNRYIRTYSAYGESGSSKISARTFANSPTDFRVLAKEIHSISLTWNGTETIKSVIYRSTDNSTWINWHDNIAPQESLYIDTKLRFSTTYYYLIFGYEIDNTLTISSSSLVVCTLNLPKSSEMIILATATYTQEQSVENTNGVINTLYPVGVTPVDLYIDINTNAQNEPNEVSKETLDEATNKIDTNYEQILNNSVIELRKFDVYGTLLSGNFARYVTVELPYKDDDNDGIVDDSMSHVEVSTLRVYCLNVETSRWEIVDAENVLDRSKKTVSVRINHFSIYALFGVNSAETNLSKAKVFPNPYKEGSAGLFGNSAFGEGVVFDKLTDNVRIKVYNISGELIVEKSISNTSGRYLWDSTNSGGSKVASGVYIYMITNTDSKSDKARGKLVIIR